MPWGINSYSSVCISVPKKCLYLLNLVWPTQRGSKDTRNNNNYILTKITTKNEDKGVKIYVKD